MTSALAIRGLAKYARPEASKRPDKRVTAARGWLLKTKARGTEDRGFKLIRVKAAGAAPDEVSQAAGDLLKAQRSDDGWPQTDKLSSDAYITGTALYALNTAGGLPMDDPAYRRGLAFLLGAQLDDGTWLVRTRSRPVQTDFESGLPHGKDQFISCVATGWAATALALSCRTVK
jgi:hypothetical protein